MVGTVLGHGAVTICFHTLDAVHGESRTAPEGCSKARWPDALNSRRTMAMALYLGLHASNWRSDTQSKVLVPSESQYEVDLLEEKG